MPDDADTIEPSGSPTSPESAKAEEEQIVATEQDKLEEAQGKAFSIGVAATFSVVYCVACIPWIHGAEKPGWGFWVFCFAGMGLVALANTPWRALIKMFPAPSARVQRKVASAAVYGVTLDYVLLMAWLCYYTGGPIRSPFSIILLTIAVLSPFATAEGKYYPMLVVLAYVLTSYLASWLAFRLSGRHEPHIPGAVVVITAVVSVVISIALEVSKRLAQTVRSSSPSTASTQIDGEHS